MTFVKGGFVATQDRSLPRKPRVSVLRNRADRVMETLGFDGNGLDGAEGWLRQQAIDYPKAFLMFVARLYPPPAVEINQQEADDPMPDMEASSVWTRPSNVESDEREFHVGCAAHGFVRC